MIVQENVTLIVSTCKLVEGKRAKCEMFWPDSKQQDQFQENLDKGMKVTRVKEDQALSSTLTLRVF